ncbi:hypothetical protein LTR85_011086 [Meristemomyces frigidus]|nr:hypothetical protein LTR85_011086 [Meristemomyces frigidus]
MHKELLCHYSEFFRGAFDGGFVEAQKGVIALQEEEERVKFTAPVGPRAEGGTSEGLSSEPLLTKLYTRCKRKDLLREFDLVERIPLRALFPDGSKDCDTGSEYSNCSATPFFIVSEDEGSVRDSSEDVGSQEDDDESEESEDEGADDGEDEEELEVEDEDELGAEDDDYGEESLEDSDSEDEDGISRAELAAVSIPRGPNLSAFDALLAKDKAATHKRLYVEDAEGNALDLVELYILADRPDICKLRDDVMTTIIYEHNRSQRISCPAAIVTAFNNLPDDAKLLRLMADEHVHFGAMKGDVADWGQTSFGIPGPRYGQKPEDALSPFWKNLVCRYHEHVHVDEIRACDELLHILFGQLADRRWEYYGFEVRSGAFRPGAAEEGEAAAIDLLQTIVTVKVGPRGVPIPVHKELLCHHAEYFRGYFDSGFEEATRGVVNLEREDEQISRMFVAWLYTQKIVPPTEARPRAAQAGAKLSVKPTCTQKRALAEQRGLMRECVVHSDGSRAPTLAAKEVKATGDDSSGTVAEASSDDGSADSSDDGQDEDDNEGDGEEDSSADEDAHGPFVVIPRASVRSVPEINTKPLLYVEQCEFDHLDLVDLYILADRRHVPKLRNEVASALIFECHRSQLLYSPLAIATAFANFPEDSRLLKLIVDEYAYNAVPLRETQPNYTSAYAKLPSDFLARLLWRVQRKDDGSDGSPDDFTVRCTYHEHNNRGLSGPGERSCRRDVGHRMWDPLHQRRVQFYTNHGYDTPVYTGEMLPERCVLNMDSRF